MSKTLSICFTSDTHGYLYPTSYADSADRPMGLMKLASAFPHDDNTLIIDGGDTIQGSPMTNLYHRLPHEEQAACLTRDDHGANPFAAMMNLAGYQFVTLGNHDFNNGLDALASYLGDLDALCLCCNIRDRAGALPIAPCTGSATGCAWASSARARTTSPAGRTRRRPHSLSSRSPSEPRAERLKP